MSDNKPKYSDELNQINKKIIAEGEVLPAVILKDEYRVQTGTVATMLYNIKLYDSGTRGEVERELELAVPTLVKLGLFELFTPDEWINGSSPGRKFIGTKAIEFIKTIGNQK